MMKSKQLQDSTSKAVIVDSARIKILKYSFISLMIMTKIFLTIFENRFLEDIIDKTRRNFWN